MKLFFTLIFSISISFSQSELLENQIDTTKSFQIEEFVISGTRIEKKIIDIPFSINRIEKREFQFEKKNSINNVLKNVPGVFLQSRYGNHDMRISIRGFGSRSNSGIRGIRILLDGIPESEPDGQTRIEAIDLHAIGKIEITKGNSSSLYTNAPGGVINFLNDISFEKSSVSIFREVGNYNLNNNGIQLKIQNDNYKFLTTFTHNSYDGFREHSKDKWKIFNSSFENKLNEFAKINFYINIVDGFILIPGSLTKEQFDENPFQANQIDLDRNTKRTTKKGRIAISTNIFMDEEKNNQINFTSYFTAKYFERIAKSYRIFIRNGFGGNFQFTSKENLFKNENEFAFGGDVFYQFGPIEEYENFSGLKGDNLKSLSYETIGNIGFYIQNNFNLIEEKLDLLFTGRLDNVFFERKNQQLSSTNSQKKFQQFTPKIALNFKPINSISFFSSFGFGFDTPAFNELENNFLTSSPFLTINPDLKSQQSKNFEVGIKSNYFEATFFNIIVDNEIVPFTIGNETYFRNSAKTNRNGIEIGTNLEYEKINLKSSYTFSNFKYINYISEIIDENLVSIDILNFKNNVVPNVPKHNFVLSLSYQKSFEKISLFGKTNYNFISKMYVNDENTETSDSYSLLDINCGINFSFYDFNIISSLGINNIFNKNYAAFININSNKKEYYEVGEPRNFFFSITLSYDI